MYLFQGQYTAIARLQADQEKLPGADEGTSTDDNEYAQNQQLRQLAAYWKSEFEKQNAKLEESAGSREQQHELDKWNRQQRHKFEAVINKLEREKMEIEDDKKKLEQELFTKVGENVLSEEQKKMIEEEVGESLLRHFENYCSQGARPSWSYYTLSLLRP